MVSPVCILITIAMIIIIYHCSFAQACLPQPGEVFDADTPCVAIGNNHNHIHPHCHNHYLRQDFHHRLSLIGVLFNS